MTAPETAPDFEWTAEPWGAALRSRALLGVASHLFTSRALRLRGTPHEERHGWEAVAWTIGVEPHRLARLTQVHGCEVVVLRREDGRRGMGGDWPEADILVCDDPGVAVAVQVADCVPLLLADPRTQAVAAAHAGWRGMAASVPRVTVDALRRAFGVRAADLVAAAGPSIGPCCCEVGADVREAFDTAGQAPDAIGRWFRPAGGAGLDLARRPGHTFLDLWAATREQLMAAGLDEANIHLSRVCSVCQVSRCWSYRRDGAGTGRMVGVIRSGPLRP